MQTTIRYLSILGAISAPVVLAQSPQGQAEDLSGRTRSAPHVVAGDPESTVPPLTTDRRELTTDLRIPIHTADRDPEGGQYGLWAGGSDYKVSFHEDFTFVPYLGEAYPVTRSFSWRTVGATVGGVPVVDPDVRSRSHTDFRFEYTMGNLVEAYDVRAEGTEQTFTLTTAPASSGDFVVVGQVTTDLRTTPVRDAHTGLVFVDDRGDKILRYGEAFAVDAAGRRTDVYTTWDHGQISLRVPGEWMEDATYPVTIDPLLNRECVAYWNSSPSPTDGEVRELDIGRDDIANDAMVAYTRAVSSSDTDLFVWLFTDDTGTFTSRNQVYTDMTSNWSTVSPAIAFGGGSADSWIIAFVRRFSSTDAVRYHVQASGDTSLSTSVTFFQTSTGTEVDVGGQLSFSTSPNVFIVYEREVSGDNTDVRGSLVDLSTGTRQPEVRIDSGPTGTSYTRIRPNINQISSSGTDGWVVAYQEYWDARSVPDDWDIIIRRIDGTGQPASSTGVTSFATPDDTHKLTPRISGSDDHYAVSFAAWQQGTLSKTGTRVGTDIHVETFDWPVGGSYSIVDDDEHTSGLVSDRRWVVSGATHDTDTESHFVTMFQSNVSGTQYVSSAGYDAGRIERLRAHSPPGAADAFGGAVFYDDDADQFLMTYASDEVGVSCGGSSSATHPVYTQVLEHLAENQPASYGTGCGPAAIQGLGRELAGVRDYTIRLSNARSNVPAVLFLAPGRDNVPLDRIGLTGCTLLVSTTLISVSTTTNGNGIADFTTPFPTNPSVTCGVIDCQWVYGAPRLNSLGLGLTEGLELDITCP